MTLATMRRRLLERVGEDPTTPVFWSTAEATAALNAAQTAMAFLTLTARKTATVTVTDSDAFADLLTLLPDVIVPLVVQAGGIRIQPKTLLDLILLNRAWPGVAGVPTSYVMLGANVIGLHPHQASQSLTILYAYVPAAMSLDAAEPDMKAGLHDALVDYAAWRLRLKEGAGPLSEAEADLRRFFAAAQAEAALVRTEAAAGHWDTFPPEITLAKAMEVSRGR